MKKSLLFFIITSFVEAACLSGPKGTLRQGPGVHFPELWEVMLYSPLKVLEERDGWSKIQDSDGVEGWVSNTSITKKYFCGSVKLEKSRLMNKKGYALFDQNYKVLKFKKRGVLALSQTGEKMVIKRKHLWIQ